LSVNQLNLVNFDQFIVASLPMGRPMPSRAEVSDFPLRRDVIRSTITYLQLADGIQLGGAFPALTG
jgi:hypothetical protein